MLVAAMVITGLICVIGSAAAATPIEISSFVNVVGEGTVDRSVVLQTDYGFGGLKYNADVYTPSLGRHGISFLNYTEELNMVLDNETMIEVVGSGTVINTKTAMGIKNYNMGTCMRYKIDGNYVLDYEHLVDNNITARYLLGKVDGKGDVSAIMKNLNNRTYIVRDRMQFDGKYKMESDFEISRIGYPASKVGVEWLGCP